MLLSINRRALLGLTHAEAVSLLRSETVPAEPTGRTERTSPSGSGSGSPVELYLIESPEPAAPQSNFMPSWLFWLRLPVCCQLPKSVSLERDALSGSLGLAVIGGVDLRAALPETTEQTGSAAASHANSRNTQRGQQGQSVQRVQKPVLVKTILPDGPAAVDGRLRCGDIILAVNGFSLAGLVHSAVVGALKAASSPVDFTLVSWPGTIV